MTDESDINRGTTNGMLSDATSPEYYKIEIHIPKPKIPNKEDKDKIAFDGMCRKCKNADFEKDTCKSYCDFIYLKDCTDFRKNRIWFKWLKVFILKLSFWKWFIPDNEYFELMEHVISEDEEDD